MEKKFSVEFYETEKGEKPCLEFLNTLEVKLRAKAFRDLKLLEEKGTELRLPYSEHLDDGIFELRTKQGTNIRPVRKSVISSQVSQFSQAEALRKLVNSKLMIRNLYFFFVGNKIIITHSFRKKTQKTPPEEIERAKEYRKDYLAKHSQKEENK